jgi:hypothetical protein
VVRAIYRGKIPESEYGKLIKLIAELQNQ